MPERKKSIIEFGQELVAARNYRGMTLEQVSDVTKVGVRYLRAMEEGEWELLPEPYMEAFLKTYAEAVGMNVPKVMKRYRETVHAELTGEVEPEPAAEGESPAPVVRPAVKKKKNRGWIGYLVGVIAILVIGGIVFALYFAPRKSEDVSTPIEYERIAPKPDTTQQAPPPQQVVPDTTARKPDSTGARKDTLGALKVTPDSLLAAPKEVPTGIRLTGRAHQPCWIRATMDKRRVQDITLAAGDTIAWRAASEVELVVGNAGGLELEMDGESLGLLGPAGKAVTVLITPEGIKSQRLGRVHLPPDTLLNIKQASKETPVDTTKADSAR